MNQQIVIKENLISFFALNLESAGTPIIFLHGWRSSKEVWQGTIGMLQNGGYPIFALDLPGFGSSSMPKQAYTIQDYAEIVLEFIRMRNLKSVILVGHSFGGRIGIKLAAQHSEVVKKLALVDSAGFATGSAKTSGYGLAAKLFKPFFKPVFMQGLRSRIYKVIGAEDYLATPKLQRTFVNVVSEDLSEDMKSIICPTLIITGENDKDTPIAFGQKMSSLIQNSKFAVLKNAGHFGFIDNPSEFINQLTGLIQA